MKEKRKPIKTKTQEIIDYWIQYEDECDLNFDWSEADEICWRCGCNRKLQRCHIIPDSLGGKDEPSNFVLLCSECHQEAPNVESKTFMWDWIKSYYSPFYNTFWNQRAMEEYERIYHKSLEEELLERNIITHHAFYKFWNLTTKKTSYHFGHPYGNVSTIAGNYRIHIEAFDKKYPNKKYMDEEGIKKEKQFESLTDSICELAEEYHFSVWEGGTRNPYSLCINTTYLSLSKPVCVSIRMNQSDNYFMFLGNGYNPNRIPIKSYTIALPKDSKSIVKRIETELKKLISQHGTPEPSSYFFVVHPYWRKKGSLSHS